MSCSIMTTWPKVHISEYRFTDTGKGFQRNQGESIPSRIFASINVITEKIVEERTLCFQPCHVQ